MRVIRRKFNLNKVYIRKCANVYGVLHGKATSTSFGIHFVLVLALGSYFDKPFVANNRFETLWNLAQRDCFYNASS